MRCETRVVDPRTPVVVGVAQLTQRPDDLAQALEPAAMMREVATAAFADAGAPRIAGDVGLVVAVKGAWSYRDPARVVADAVGASDARTALTTDGGNTPQLVVDVVAERIADGALDVALVVGAEGIWSRRRMRSAGIEGVVLQQPEHTMPDEVIGTDLALTSAQEQAHGITAPVEVYPLFESAIRARRGETLDAHRDRVAALWARFNAVAVTNPHAWRREPMTAAQIRNPSPGNRMVAFPYTKAMCSNWDLDQAAALVVCSAEAAERHGVARDRWVFVHGGAEAEDTALVTRRRDLASSPAIATAWSALARGLGVGIDDVGHIDLYSCFPSAVQAAATAIDASEDRPLTVTGGMTFAGGPLNNYVTHSIAAMVNVLRDEPGALGLVTANGGFLTKHAIGLYSASPPGAPFRRVRTTPDVQPRDAAHDHVGRVSVEACTVMHDHDGPVRALFAALTTDGRRTWASSDDIDTMNAAMTTELVGAPADVDPAGRLHVLAADRGQVL